MPKFIVHLFPLVRVKFKAPIEAETYEEAVEKTTKLFRPRDIFDHEDASMVVEDAEEMPYACVDVEGDTEFKLSRWVHIDTGASFGNKIYQQFRGLVKWARHVCECFGAPPEVVCDAVDLVTEMDQDLAAQRKGPA